MLKILSRVLPVASLLLFGLLFGLALFFNHHAVSLNENTREMLLECQRMKEGDVTPLPPPPMVTTPNPLPVVIPTATALSASALMTSGTVATSRILNVAIPYQGTEGESVRVLVGPGKQVRVIVWSERSDIEKLTSSFFSIGDGAAKKQFNSALKTADDLTLELTTIRPGSSRK